MMQKEVALKVLNSEVSLDDLTLKPVPHMRNRCLTFLNLSHLLDTVEKAISTVNISYAVIWVRDNSIILDFPDIDAKMFFFNTDSQIILDTLEDICKKYISEVIIYN